MNLKTLKFLIFNALVILISACQKADLSEISNLRGNEIGIIGHGGLGFQSPEVNLPSNSWESITKAIEGYQADGVEVDVQISADGQLFLYHDSRLQTLTDCVGCIYQYTAEEIENCKYVAGFNTQHFNDERLVKLETVIQRMIARASKPLIFLDLKTSPDCPHTFEYSVFENQFLESLKEMYETYNCADWIITETSDFNLAQRLKNEVPEIRINYFAIINQEAIDLAVANDFWGISANFGNAELSAIQEAHTVGLFVTLGILRNRNDAHDLIKRSPDFIYTDNIPLLQEMLD